MQAPDRGPRGHCMHNSDHASQRTGPTDLTRSTSNHVARAVFSVRGDDSASNEFATTPPSTPHTKLTPTRPNAEPYTRRAGLSSNPQCLLRHRLHVPARMPPRSSSTPSYASSLPDLFPPRESFRTRRIGFREKALARFTASQSVEHCDQNPKDRRRVHLV